MLVLTLVKMAGVSEASALAITLVLRGDKPYRKHVREGLHAGAHACALVNETPFAASASMFGVGTV